ncbi:MAG: DUF4153 domain-containing protein [Fibrobacter sp.]|nr:DUF4153 domain-containing protein [Fibrobacter sp.]
MDLAKIKQYPTQISNVFKRFPLPMGFAIFACLYSMALARMVGKNQFIENHPKYFIWVATFALLSIFLTTACKLVQEARNYSPKTGWIITGVSEAVLMALTAGYIANGNPDNAHFIAKSVVWIAIVVLSPLVVPFFRGKNDIPLWNFIGKVVISFLISSAITSLFYGAMAALAGCAHLLTNFDFFDGMIFFDMASICTCIVFPTLFYAGFPSLREPNENSETSKYFNNTIHFLFIPVLLLYILFVYAFTIKIGFDQSHEQMSLSTMALIAVSSTILIGNIIYPSHFKDGFDKKFLKIIPWLVILPTLLSLRNFVSCIDHSSPDEHFILFYVITVHIWLLASLIILLVPRIKKKIWWTVVSLIITAIISTFSPVNVFTLGAHSYLRHSAHRQAEWAKDSVARAQEREREELVLKSIKYFEFKEQEYSFIAVPPNRSSMAKLENTYLSSDQFVLDGDTIFIKVRPNGYSSGDTLFASFSVPLSLLKNINDDTDDDDVAADIADSANVAAAQPAKGKPTSITLDNGSETLILTSVYFKICALDSSRDYGSIRGYWFFK